MDALDVHGAVVRRAVRIELDVRLLRRLHVGRESGRVAEHVVVVDLFERRPKEGLLLRSLVNDVQPDQAEGDGILAGAGPAAGRVVDGGHGGVVAALRDLGGREDLPRRLELDRAVGERDGRKAVEDFEPEPSLRHDSFVLGSVHVPLVAEPATLLVGDHAADGLDAGRLGDLGEGTAQQVRGGHGFRGMPHRHGYVIEERGERLAVAPPHRHQIRRHEDLVGVHLRLPHHRTIRAALHVQYRFGGVRGAVLTGRPVEGDELVPGEDIRGALQLAMLRAGGERDFRRGGRDGRQAGRARASRARGAVGRLGGWGGGEGNEGKQGDAETTDGSHTFLQCGGV